MWEFGRASDEEGLRLMVAFFKIGQSEHRRAVIELAERLAEQSRPSPPSISLPQDNQPEE
jgi:hypothetical protein